MSGSNPISTGPGECIVHVKVNGICGDYILGHEGAGQIVAVGSDVRSFVPGDRVAIESGIHCGTYTECSTGSYNLCADVTFTGAPPYDGSIRRSPTHDSRYLHKLPDSMTYTQGALLAPLNVVKHALERSPIKLGQPTLICGAEIIGLIALAAARASGAFPIVITDIDAERLDSPRSFIPGCYPFHVPPELAVIVFFVWRS